MRRLILPLVFGLVGAAVLTGLGLWQVQRLAWKEGVLADIAARMDEAPGDLPAQPMAGRDAFMPVALAGRFTGQAVDVLVSRKQVGPGFRVVAAFQTEGGRRILVDRGFLREDARGAGHGPSDPLRVTGNLHWPDEVDGFTPAPDAARGIWFARDLPALAAALGTDAVLVVARSDTGEGIAPWPVDTSGIPNDHLGYAVQWFLLAAVWLGMTFLYLWRMRRRTG
jgi:surfeit locus 1 family protein